MAKPAFIYAFDNMGSERFTELASLLLASRYQGFLLGGAGSDGGIDAEIDPTIGELRPESRVPLIGELVTPADLVIFQFKHQVTARVGQGQSRTKLLAEFTCNDNASCDLHAKLIKARKPSVYVVVTNVEITPQFREKFIAESKAHNPEIKHYQIIGLNELEAWIAMEPELRHLYLPTIYGPARFQLNVQVRDTTSIPVYRDRLGQRDLGDAFRVLQIQLVNTGMATSYVDSITFRFIEDGRSKYLSVLDELNDDQYIHRLNETNYLTTIEPGRKSVRSYRLDALLEGLTHRGITSPPVEVLVKDEVGNEYSAIIPQEIFEPKLNDG